MAFLEDVTKGGWTMALIGVGVAMVAPTAMSALGGVLRPLAKALIKGGVIAYDAVKDGVAQAGEQINDVVDEARAELVAAEGEAEKTARAPEAGSSSKDKDVERKPPAAKKES